MCPYVMGMGISIRIIVRVSRAPPARCFDFETGEIIERPENMISYGSYCYATAVLGSSLNLVKGKVVTYVC